MAEMKKTRRLAVAAMVLAGLPALAGVQAVLASSSDGVWSGARSDAVAGGIGPRPQILDWRRLDEILAGAPVEFSAEAAAQDVRLSLPMPDGSYRIFRIENSPIMPESLASEIGFRSFAGSGVDDPSWTVRFDTSSRGFRALALGGDGAVFVEPAVGDGGDAYVARSGAEITAESFECFARDTGKPFEPESPTIASGTQLRHYRLAVAATGEFTQFFGSQAAAITAIGNTVNAINTIYQRDVAIRMDLVANEANIVFTDPSTDPFPLANLNTEGQAAIDAGIGTANYDVGHTFHASGFSGNAGCVGCACTSGSKGSGYSQDGTPGDADYTFLTSHEMGHQVGGRHTFNGNGCSPGQYSAGSAWEPGSGSTIMSYSSICGVDNQLGSAVGNLYFHGGSRSDVMAYTRSGGGNACGTNQATGNAVPTVGSGADYTIPQGTPFVLTATGSDPDGGSLTFSWEQLDLGPTAALSAVDQGSIPLFRSFPPSLSPSRTFPQFSDLLAGSGSLFPGKLGEQLASTNRTLNFRATVRDNQIPTGAAEDDAMVITVSGSPFTVDNPNGSDRLECGTSDTVSWTVGGGTVALTVNILLSTDGGGSFPTTLAAATPNDGSQPVSVPQTLSSSTRVRIDSVGNVFFNVSAPTSIVDTLNPSITAPSDVTAECTSPAGTPVALGSPTATDACDTSLAVSNDAPGLFPLGGTTLTWTAQDDSGNSDSDTQLVTVEDTTPPTILCPANIKVECTGDCGIHADDPQLDSFFAGVSAIDVCDAGPTIGNNAPAFLDLGVHVVTFTAMDHSGNGASCQATVTVQDTIPPEITVVLNRDVLWPPNHKLADITATVTVTDICDPHAGFRLTSIVSDEPDNGLGDGDTANDIQGASYGTADTAFQLRSERGGLGDGRVYTITYTAYDKSGNETPAVVTVRVSHDQAGGAKPSGGFSLAGTNFSTGARWYELLVLSNPAFNASRIDPRDALVGNTFGVVRASGSRLVDVNRDGLLDLDLTYPVDETNQLRKLSGSKYPLGLHYDVGDELDYAVPDIFRLGAPIPSP